MPSQLAHFVDFADYNRWANRRLYDAVAALPEGAFEAARSAAFFDSLMGVLNHLLVADRIWMDRLEHLPPADLKLNTVLHPGLSELRAAREAMDARIAGFVGALSEADLDGTVAYKTGSGTPQSERLGTLLAHVFNHQTHHRGQAHALLTDAGTVPPPLDYLYYRRERQQAGAAE